MSSLKLKTSEIKITFQFASNLRIIDFSETFNGDMMLQWM